jgi:hypothetical protein
MVISMALAVVLSGPVQEATFLQLSNSLTISRWANATPEERAKLAPLKERLESLQIYVSKCEQVMQIGRWVPQDSWNYLQVMRDLVDAGEQLCTSPEERLCWQAVGVKLAFEHYRFTKSRVEAGTDPQQQLKQAQAQFEYFRTNYNRVLKECKPMPQ